MTLPAPGRPLSDLHTRRVGLDGVAVFIRHDAPDIPSVVGGAEGGGIAGSGGFAVAPRFALIVGKLPLIGDAGTRRRYVERHQIIAFLWDWNEN